MPGRQSLRDPRRERRQFARRAIVTGLVVVTLYGVMAARLIYLQVIDHEHYAMLSQENRVHIVAVPPPRGLIYDRHGVLLAENVPAYSLEVTPDQVPDMFRTLAALKRIIHLSPDDVQHFREALRHKLPFQSVTLRLDLSPDEVARFAVQRYRFPGVDIRARLRRYYPFGSAMADAVGYVGRIDPNELRKVDAQNYEGTTHFGKTGIEAFYQNRLHGQVGYDEVEVNAKGRPIRVLSRQPPVPGADLVLSLDAGLQLVGEQALAGLEGAVVAMDPRNGDVLALVSAPGYDPNWFVDGISSKRYASLQANAWQPLFNRALAGQYPPGSTIKPFMALAGLNDAVVTADERIYCGPYWQIPGDPAHRKYRDWNRYGHGMTDVSKAITQSVDVYFYRLAFQLGIKRMHGFLSRFGFGRPTGIDTPGEMAGLLPTPAWKRRTKNTVWYPGNTVVAGIGQGFVLATPLQLAEATAALAMQGKRFQPRLLRAVRDPVTRDVTATLPLALPTVGLGSSSYWEAVVAGMRNVTQRPDGTAYRQFRDFAYVVAGKTGTAQVTSHIHSDNASEGSISYRLRDNGLFIAFAPADHPLIAVAVVVEHGGGGDVSAAPIARRMIAYYLKHNTEQRGDHLVAKPDLPKRLDLQPTEPVDGVKTSSIGESM